MNEVRKPTFKGNDVYVGHFRLANTPAVMAVVFGKDIRNRS